MLNLDTHILIHSLYGELTKREKELLSSDQWSISAIVMWELAKLSQLDRVELELTDPEVLRTLSRIYIWPVTLEICQQISRLDFHSDPADELIAATSLAHNIPLVTRDKKIRKSKIVPWVR